MSSVICIDFTASEIKESAHSYANSTWATYNVIYAKHQRIIPTQHIKMSLTKEEKFIYDLWKSVTKKARVKFLNQITSSSAFIFPVKEIIRRVREAGIITVIDRAHVAG